MIAEIFINGVISQFDPGFDTDFTNLSSVRRQYDSFTNVTEVIAFINSVGGDVREGFAIHDFLREKNVPVTTIATGKVFSIATIVFLAGDRDRRFMRPNSEGLVHNPIPAMPVHGDADTFERVAESLRVVENELAEFYSNQTNLNIEESRQLMKNDSLISPSEMVEMGFASAIQEELRAVAIFLNENNLEMTDNTEEIKGIKKSMAKILSFFENKEDEKPDPKPDDKEAKKEETEDVEALKAQLATAQEENKTLSAKVAQFETENETIKKTQEEQLEVINQVKLQIPALEKKIKELEEMPIIPDSKEGDFHAVEKPAGLQLPKNILNELDKVAGSFNAQYNN